MRFIIHINKIDEWWTSKTSTELDLSLCNVSNIWLTKNYQTSVCGYFPPGLNFSGDSSSPVGELSIHKDLFYIDIDEKMFVQETFMNVWAILNNTTFISNLIITTHNWAKVFIFGAPHRFGCLTISEKYTPAFLKSGDSVLEFLRFNIK